MNAYLAIDLGAESGRVMLGTLADGRVTLEEIHRFPNRSLTENGHLHWDLAHLQGEIFAGLEKAAAHGTSIAGISTDSWGVDYVLLDRAGKPLGNPYCYRDARTHDATARLFKKLPFAEIYHETGIQFMTINTIYHLEAQQHDDPSVLANAGHFLNIADYFNAQLCGVAAAEQSLASTTQVYNPRTQAWSEKIAATLGLKKSLFPARRAQRHGPRPGNRHARAASGAGAGESRRLVLARHRRGRRRCPPPPATTGPISAPAPGRSSARNCPPQSSPTPRARRASPTKSASAAPFAS